MTNPINHKVFNNTIVLLVRLVVIITIGFITARYVLKNLGIENYGIYNVVFGFMGIFTFFTNSISDTCQRYFSIEIQNDNVEKLNVYFSFLLYLSLFVCIAFASISEVFVLDVVIKNFVFPNERTEDIIQTFRILVLSYIFQIIAIPFCSIILAFEKIHIYALVTISEVVFKFMGSILLIYSPFDRLTTYASLIALVNFTTLIAYYIYCHRSFVKMSIQPFKKALQVKETSKFTSWNLFGSLASVMKTEGTNTLLNLFHGPILNAARGISFQLTSVLNMFALNLSQVVRLQVYKYYADKKFNELNDLVLKSSKFQFFAVLIISLPLLLETKFVLDIWLIDYPDATITFVRLGILVCLIDSLSYSIMAAILATGRIIKYSLTVGGVVLLNLPLSYYFLHLQHTPDVILKIACIVSGLAFFTRLAFYSRFYKKSIRTIVCAILEPTLLVFALASIIPVTVVITYNPSWVRFIATFVLCLSNVIFFVYIFGMNTQERLMIKNLIYTYRRRNQ